mmetsp:Transcript_15318/g.45906  ORF Transcript_15318/g.45906 Transcript_15318/m.45906 type:complete len:313 (+) Transcript_15318:615-1553(+)
MIKRDIDIKDTIEYPEHGLIYNGRSNSTGQKNARGRGLAAGAVSHEVVLLRPLLGLEFDRGALRARVCALDREDALRRLDEDRLDERLVFGRQLDEQHAVEVREGLPLRAADLPLLLEVRLVAREHQDEVRVRGVLLGLVEPARQVVEALAPRHVVDEQAAVRAAVVAPRDGQVRLLARGVPDLEVRGRAVGEFDGARVELDADGHVVRALEVALREHEHDGRLADLRVADDDVLEQMRLRVCRHGCGVARAAPGRSRLSRLSLWCGCAAGGSKLSPWGGSHTQRARFSQRREHGAEPSLNVQRAQSPGGIK